MGTWSLSLQYACCCDQRLTRSSVRKGGIILAHSSRDRAHYRGEGMVTKARSPVTLHPQSGNREMNAGAQPTFSFFFIPQNDATIMQGGSSHRSALGLENPPPVRSETCLLGDSERCLVGAIHHHKNDPSSGWEPVLGFWKWRRKRGEGG